MRLIDADTLEAEFRRRADTFDKELVCDLFHISEIVIVIDKAQTVPLPDFKEGYKQAILDGKTNFSRPQGKWIITGEEQGVLGITYKIRKCDKCSWKHSLVIPDNFCPNCGADMRKGDRE